MNGWLLPLGAVAAGIVSATSPCVLPVLPGYLATLTAQAGPSTGPRARVHGALGFVAGFTAVFTALGATASAVGDLLYTQLPLLLRLVGVVLVVVGFHALGWIRMPALAYERRLVRPESVGTGPRRSFLLGAAFALGWTPCIGPVLALILTKAAASASLTEGVVLLLLYSAGLGLPFLALAVGFERSVRARQFLGRQGRRLQTIGGVTIVVVGVGYATGVWSLLFVGIQGWLARTGWPPL